MTSRAQDYESNVRHKLRERVNMGGQGMGRNNSHTCNASPATNQTTGEAEGARVQHCCRSRAGPGQWTNAASWVPTTYQSEPNLQLLFFWRATYLSLVPFRAYLTYFATYSASYFAGDRPSLSLSYLFVLILLFSYFLSLISLNK